MKIVVTWELINLPLIRFGRPASERNDHHAFKGKAVRVYMESTYCPEPLSTHSLDQLLGQKAAVLRTKLNVFGAELRDRFRLREQNLSALASERDQLDADVERVSRLVRYDLREPRDLSPFVQQRAQLYQELRRQTVTCWTDLVPVVRDLLEVWEALEQSRSRSHFLHHARPGTA